MQVGRAYHRTDASARLRDIRPLLERLAVVLTDPNFSDQPPRNQISKAGLGWVVWVPSTSAWEYEFHFIVAVIIFLHVFQSSVNNQ